MTLTSNKRLTETVMFAGMCANVRETYANFFLFLADQRASRKVSTSKKKAFCVLQFAKTETVITVQRAFRIKIDCLPPNDNNILRQYHQFETTGCLCNGKVREDQDCNWYPPVTGSAYLDTLQLWLFPQLEESEPNNFNWRQDGATPHWHLSVRDWLNITVPKQWIGRRASR
ncbi:uncharacterized protein TNCV_354651 [Trichonephila clavipes]|uniref:Uncharacterized protein n=1 Tax=Trichonephila clavipes TaxID=2585209 RepID=A0A8X7BD04_TRICX|nr:uncharacterized protein TNCV_354651 [Trichonephila clavipes]